MHKIFCFTISLFHASTCFEHMCSKHVDKYTEMHGQQNVKITYIISYGGIRANYFTSHMKRVYIYIYIYIYTVYAKGAVFGVT